MDKPKLLIVDPSEDFRYALAQSLRGTYTVSTAGDGIHALELLQSLRPDILVLDLMLPGLDGITLLQKAAQMNLRPKALAATRYLSDYTLEAAQRMGIGYVMLKPCDTSAVAARVADLSQSLKPAAAPTTDPRTQVTNILLRLGFPTKLRGYGYLREAVLLMQKDPEQSITKELYPHVAALFRATPIQIERSIRSAITTAWARRDHEVWQLFFPYDDTGNPNRPTNATLICRLADHLSLEATILPEE